MNEKNNGETIEINSDVKVKAVDLPFDFDRTDVRWEQYGIKSVPLLVRDGKGTLYDDRKFKGVFLKDKYHRIVSRGYVVFPNEEVNLIVNQALERHPDLHLRQVHTSHNGDAMYWELMSDKLNQVVKGSWKKDDTVGMGCIVRNSVGAGVALGIDMFTYRLSCENGAVARGHDLASLAIRHYKTDPESMRLTVSRRIYDVVEETSQLLAHYRKAAVLKFTQPMAREMTKRVPIKYLPDYVQVEKDSVTLSNKNKTFWEAFNDVTENVWHSDKLGFLSKSDALQHAHAVMIQANAGRIK